MSDNISQLLFYNVGGNLEYVCSRKSPCDHGLVPHKDWASKPDWSILKMTYDGSDNLIKTYFANGSATCDKIADEREHYKYTEALITRLVALQDVGAGTTIDLTTSDANYTKTGDNGSIGANAGEFAAEHYMQVLVEDEEQEKSIGVIWVSATSCSITQAVLTGQIIKIYS